MTKPYTSSIKNTGDKNVTPGRTKMSPQGRAEIATGGRMRFESMWAPASLLSILDDRLSDFAFRVRELFLVPRPGGRSIALSHKELAVVMGCSERQAQRVVAELERHGDFEVIRRRNRRNEYRIISCVTEEEQNSDKNGQKRTFSAVKRTKPALRPCVRCKTPVYGLGKGGFCRTCVNDAKLGTKIDLKLDERGVPRRPTFDELSDKTA